jgi:hypothetical protein
MDRLTDRDDLNQAVVHPQYCGDDISWEDYIGLLLDRLAAYEDTGLTPEDLKEVQDALGKTPMNRFYDIMQAEREGRLVVLPCKVGDMVYAIEEEYFDCENCLYGNEAHYDKKINRVCCDLYATANRHCPYRIQEQIAKGFEISNDNGKPVLSAPGEWGYEGLEPIQGIDGKWYLSREEAEAALKELITRDK